MQNINEICESIVGIAESVTNEMFIYLFLFYPVDKNALIWDMSICTIQIH
jgi:hypothetical protein